jgi:hypothetical protein
MSEAELDQLAEDIQANGIRNRIILLPDGQLIDGRNRLDAAERAGLRIFDDRGDWAIRPRKLKREPDPYLYVLSANFHRRHLTSEQRDEVIRKLKVERPKLSVRALAAATNTSKSTAARALKPSGVPNGTADEFLTGGGGKRYSTERKRSPKPKAPRAQVRDSAIGSFCIQLSQKPLDTLEDLSRILRGAQGQIIALPLPKRRILTLEYLKALHVRPIELQAAENEL